ncbi:MAG: preprotein translocase subunit SecA, partial [Gammaproteobacteria bacterium]
YDKLVAATGSFEAELKEFADDALRARTDTLRARYQDTGDIDALLPEAFAMVREAAQRTLGMRPFDVQRVGGIALHEGKIAEMRTGEGKTLVATLPAYLNALSGGSVHIVTVNDYLARRDAEWMGPVYEFLGLSVGVVAGGQSPADKRAAYQADITYGTNNEFGFDYLRDNLAFRLEDVAQRKLAFAIVDEVDSILIDEARTPLIISGPSEESTELYAKLNRVVPKLAPQLEEDGPGDYSIDEKGKQAHLTEAGQDRIEDVFVGAGLLSEGESLYDPASIRLMHHLNAALRAHALFKRDVDYIVKDGEVVIVDEFTGRTMAGRRWSDGLHQAIEAKEGVRIKEETQTVASITFQNYFRIYTKLAGMTGTADTEAYEFQQIYGLEVLVVPTHQPMVRADNPDLVHLTQSDKFAAIIEDIEDCHQRGQPVLVGTTSIETSEELSDLLKKQKIPHRVLNAKFHEQEAEIVTQAGRPGTITIATNMAGRGTDIVLGGSLEAELAALGEATDSQHSDARADWQQRHDRVIQEGGLHIIGTERHESRRIDNQLRGRSGRQGDPGSSRFYLSMEDNLMRIFGDPQRTKKLLSSVGMKPGEVIESKLLSRQIERAQRKVEAHNFDIRKQLLEYDDVANDQRKVVYEQRTDLMAAEDMADAIVGIREEVVNEIIDEYFPRGSVEEQWDPAGLSRALEQDFGLRMDIAAELERDKSLNDAGLRESVFDRVQGEYETKVTEIQRIGADMRALEKEIMLRQLDLHWKEHLAAMDYLRQGINLRAYAQKNPKQEYKREAFEMFTALLERVKRDAISILSRIQIRDPEDATVERRASDTSQFRFQHAEASALGEQPPPPMPGAGGPIARRQRPGGSVPNPEPATPFVRDQPKVGRNEACPCGSGKKYKHCHGRPS